jgi:hypothetical protein
MTMSPASPPKRRFRWIPRLGGGLKRVAPALAQEMAHAAINQTPNIIASFTAERVNIARVGKLSRGLCTDLGQLSIVCQQQLKLLDGTRKGVLGKVRNPDSLTLGMLCYQLVGIKNELRARLDIYTNLLAETNPTMAAIKLAPPGMSNPVSTVPAGSGGAPVPTTMPALSPADCQKLAADVKRIFLGMQEAARVISDALRGTNGGNMYAFAGAIARLTALVEWLQAQHTYIYSTYHIGPAVP